MVKSTLFAAACLLINSAHHQQVDAFRASFLTSQRQEEHHALPLQYMNDASGDIDREDSSKTKDAPASMMARVSFDPWDNSKSPHIANGYGEKDPGPILWQYAYHGNWHEVYTRVCSNPDEAKYIRDNGWTPLHLLVAGNGTPAPLKVIRAVYDAFPSALEMRTFDYNRTPMDIAKRWNQPQDIIDFLSNPEKFSLCGNSNAHSEPDDPVNVDNNIFLIIDDDTGSGAGAGTGPGADVATAASQGGGEVQQPVRQNGPCKSKPLSADAIVVTSLQNQHADFVQNQIKELKQLNENLVESNADDKTKIMRLELENHSLKEKEKQTQTELQEAQNRLKELENEVTQRYQAEVEVRVSEIQQRVQAEVETLKGAEDTKMKNLERDLAKSKEIEGQMRNAVVSANSEVEALKQQMKSWKETEKQMRSSVFEANSELEEEQQRSKRLEGKMEELKQRSQAEVESLKLADDMRLIELEKDLESMKRKEEQMRSSVIAANADREEMQHRLKRREEQMQSAVVTANAEVREAQKQLEILEEQVSTDKRKIMALERKMEKSKETEEQMRSAVVEANAEFREAHKRWEGIEDQVETLAKSERSLLAQVERLREELKERELEYLALSEEKDAQRKEFEMKLYEAKNPDAKRSWYDGYGTRSY